MKAKASITTRGWLILLISALLSAPAVAVAGENSDVTVLLTQVVEGDIADGDQQIQFWWSQADEPHWTKSDEFVFAALRNAGVEPAMPSSIDISRIYRRPGLSIENAAQVGRLLASHQVLVGEIQYRSLAPVAPLGLRGVEASAVVELVPAGDAGGVSLERFTVTRKVFGEDTEALLERAKKAAGEALGDVMGQSLRRASSEVGSHAGDELLALRNLERSENLEKVRQRLIEIEEVDRVVERWASEGIIALEVGLHDGGGNQAGMLDYVYRVLENHEFENFRLMRSEHSSLDRVTEFWLEPREARF